MARPRLEFYSHDVNLKIRDKMHCHPFWQLEWIVSGREIYIDDIQQNYPLRGECLILIPPLSKHRFSRLETPNEVHSFKFAIPAERKWDGSGIKILPVWNDFTHWLLDIMRPLLNDKTAVAGPQIESCLMILVEYMLTEATEYKSEPLIFEHLDMLVQTDRHDINVKTAAEKLNLTVSQLKYRFLRESRQMPELHAGTSVKAHIDKCLIALIDRYLEYSSLSIAELAKELRFPDPYTLSHFYRRNTGHSPTSRRQP